MQGGDEHDDILQFSSKLGLIKHGQSIQSHRYMKPQPSPAQATLPAKRHLRNVEGGFTHLRDGGTFSDAIIHVGHTSFPVHRNILACSSPYFRALFTSPLTATTDQDRSDPDIGLDQKNKIEHFLEGGLKTERLAWCEETSQSDSSDPHLPQMADKQLCTTMRPHDDEAGDTNLKHFHSKMVEKHDHQQSAKCPVYEKSPFNTNVRPSSASISDLTNSSNVSQLGTPHAQSRSAFSQFNNPRRFCSSRYEVSLEDVSPETVDNLIQHAYGGQVTVTADNVEHLLTAADRFQVSSLINECCTFLLSELTISNCISVIKFSSRFYACDALRKTATRFLLDNFPLVFQQSAEFEGLNQTELSALLRADQLNVKHEETVLDAIIRWVLADVAGRLEVIPELVKCVRVGLMLPENMREFVDSWLVSSNLSSEFNHVTLQVMEAVLQCQKEQMTMVDGAMFSPRLPRDVLFVIGGSNFGFPLNLVEAFDCRTFGWSVICPYDFAPRSYHGMVALGKDIYVIGGFSGHVYLSSCCKLRADSLTWENVTPMNTKRCYVGAVTVKGSIYTIGGYDGVYRLNSAERFSAETNQWSFISPMMQQRSDAGVTVLDDKVYVCGGFNGIECIRSVEQYDPELDQWSTVTSMPKGRSGLGLAAFNGRIYAVGGFDGVDSAIRLSVVECFDPETKQWTELEPMFHPRSNLAVEVLEDIMYAIGGYCGDRTTSAVECYDFDTNTWFESGQLSHNRSALGACVVSGLSNTADILQRNGPERCALVHSKD